jgi:hypothetical protein
MTDYYLEFLSSALLWLVWGVFYLFGFRRAKSSYVRSLGKYNGAAWAGITAWMVYNLFMWRRSH